MWDFCFNSPLSDNKGKSNNLVATSTSTGPCIGTGSEDTLLSY